MKRIVCMNQMFLRRVGLSVGLGLLFLCLCIAPAMAERVVLPESLTEIADEAFLNNASITSVEIPFGAARIGARAFAGCGNLQEIIIPATVREIDEDAFSGCDELTILCRSGSAAEKYASQYGIAHDSYEITAIPEGLQYTVSDTYATITGYSGNATKLILPDVIEGKTVTTIVSSSFANNTILSEINLPNNLTSIGYNAFSNCDSLASIVLPDSIQTLYGDAFYSCDLLESVNYPKSWSSTGSTSSFYYNRSPFDGCNRLTSIVVPENVTAIPNYAFKSTYISTVFFPESLKRLGEYSFSDTPLTTVSIPEGVTAIPSHAFSDCDRLISIDLPDTIISISYNAFSNCDSLTRIVLPDSIQTLYGDAFYSCDSLESVNYPKSWSSTGSTSSFYYNRSPFDGCNRLTSIVVPDGVITIPNYSFKETYLLQAYVSGSVTTIGSSAFADLPDGFVMYGVSGSYAETYAAENGISFSTDPFPGFETDEPDEPETPGTITFSGYVTFEDGMPLPDVEIYAYNAAEELIDYDCTDDDGAWSCEAIPDEQCTIRYYHDVYTIEPTEVGVITSDDMVFDTAIASVGGVYGPAVPSFTMQINGEDIPAEGVMVGDPVTFTITADNMTKVRLVADGRAYDEYYLTDGSATFDRNFSRAGERAIAFQAYTGSDWTIPCEAQTLVVNASGTLDEPVIHDIGTQYVGEDFTVTWDAVDNADSYTVYLYRDELLWPALSNTSAATTDGLSMEISGDLLYMNGEYLIEIIASGYGYSQSSSSMTFKVEATAASVEIAYPTDGMTYNIGDTMHTRMALGSGTAGARLLVTPPEGEETFIAPDESGVFYPAADFVGDYVLTPYYSASSSDFTKDTADGTGESVTVHVSAPKIISLTHDTNKVYSIRYSGAAPEFIGRVSDARYTVTVSLNGEAIAEITPEEDGSFAYTADALAAYGEYVYSFVPCYGAIAGEQKDFPVYIIEQQEASVRYAAEPIAMLGRPGGAMVATIPYAAEVTILGTYGTEYLYVSTAEASGFVAAGSNLAEAVEAGEIEVSVTETASVPYTAVGGVREYRIDHENLVSAYAEVILPDDETVVRYDAVRNETEFIIDIPVDTVGGYKCNFYASSMVDELIVCGMNTFFGVDTSYEYTGQECWSNKSRYLEDLRDPIFADREITSFDVTKHNMKCIGGGEDNYIYIETTSRDNGIVNYYMVHASEIQYVKNVTVYRALLIVNPYEKENVEDDVCMRNIERMTRTLGEIDHIYINSTSARAKDQDEIRNAINQFIAWSDYNDVTYIYWSGHGNGSSGQSQYSWNITPSENNPSDFYLYLSLRYQLTHFNGKVNLIIDSCYSGDFVSVPGAPDIPETVAILMATSSGEVSIFVSPTTGKPVAELGGKFTVAMTNYVAEHPNVTLEELKNNVRISGLVKEFPFWSSPTTTMWGDPNRVFFAPDTDEVN